MTAAISLVVWFFGSLRLFIAPVSGVILFLTLYAFTPRYLGIGVGEDGMSLSAKRLLVFSCMLAVIGLYLKFDVYSQKDVKKNTSKVFVLLFLFYLVSCISSFLNSDSLVSYLRFIEDSLVLITGILIGAVLARKANGSRMICMFAFFIPLVISTLIVFLEIIKGAPILAGILDSGSSIAIGDKGREFSDVKIRDSRYRAKAMFDGQLMFAEFVVYCLPAILYANHIRMINGATAFLLIGCVMFSLWATGSRGGIVIFVIIFLFFFFCTTLKHSKKIVRVVVPAITLVSTVVAILYLYQLVSGLEIVDNFSVIDDRSERSTYGRLLQFQIVSNLVSDSPLYGFGYKRNISDAFEQIFTIDNFYLVSALQGGVLGLGLFLVALLYSGVTIFNKSMRYSNHDYNFGVWILSFLIAFSSMKLFLSQYSNNFYMILMVSFALNRLSKLQSKTHRHKKSMR